jgi:hypothetical protein
MGPLRPISQVFKFTLAANNLTRLPKMLGVGMTGNTVRNADEIGQIKRDHGPCPTATADQGTLAQTSATC